ncbi:MAG: hypothetical protein ACR2LV_04145 [Solirubrobacteraceae bacterium]
MPAEHSSTTYLVLHALAVLFALIAIGAMVSAIAGMLSGRVSARRGALIRAAAVLCFVVAVVLNVVSR